MTERPALSDRQRREIEYHQQFSRKIDLERQKISYEIAESRRRRWWNAYWASYTILLKEVVMSRRILVMGCGFGKDALVLSKLGADVYAFDLSEDMLALAKQIALREGLKVDFRQMPAEQMDYKDDFFDGILAVNILHHVDIPKTLSEIQRVSKKGAFFIANEVYSHSLMHPIRHYTFVKKFLYPRLVRFVYGSKDPYITEDERKLTECDVRLVKGLISNVRCEYFNFIVTRLLPRRWQMLNILDRLALIAFGPLAYLFGGRILIAGKISK
ncbi:MAG: class I SAM-dependent methyltransferase [bacterium]